MLISLTKSFLFVHVIKTGGMSVETALMPYDARSTGIGIGPAGVDPGVFALQRHTSAADLKAALPQGLFETLFKFAFVRNPWDLELSLYHFNKNHPEFHGHKSVEAFESFEDFVMALDPTVGPRPRQVRPLVNESGAALVDFVGHFETLEKDFQHICEKIGVPAPPLPHRNKSDHPPWQEVYTDEMLSRVADLRRPDFETFGYSMNRSDYAV